MKNGRDSPAQNDPISTAYIDVSQLRHRLVRPDELLELRSLWWRQVALGHRLPPQINIIIIEGDVVS